MEQVSIKNGLFGVLTFMVILAVMGFFAVAAVRGEFGLFRLFQVQAVESRLVAELDELTAQHARLANRTKRLSNDYLDLDLLDEQVRRVLGMARGDEIIIR